MITEDYVSFEVAKLLKEKGFDENIITYRDNFIQHGNIVVTLQECLSEDKIKTPTHQMTLKWLREVYNIFIIIDYVVLSKSLYEYTYEIHDMYKGRSIAISAFRDDYETYEEAVEDALKYCLTNLIK